MITAQQFVISNWSTGALTGPLSVASICLSASFFNLCRLGERQLSQRGASASYSGRDKCGRSTYQSSGIRRRDMCIQCRGCHSQTSSAQKSNLNNDSLLFTFSYFSLHYSKCGTPLAASQSCSAPRQPISMALILM